MHLRVLWVCGCAAVFTLYVQGGSSELGPGLRVDLDCECYTICLLQSGLGEIWQKRLGSWTRWWNTRIQVNPTKVPDQMRHPVYIAKKASILVTYYSQLPLLVKEYFYEVRRVWKIYIIDRRICREAYLRKRPDHPFCGDKQTRMSGACGFRMLLHFELFIRTVYLLTDTSYILF